MSKYVASLKKGITGAVTAVTKAAEVAKEIADESQRQLLNSAKVFKDYQLGALVATSGPFDVWKVHNGTCVKQGSIVRNVSIWILDKRALLEQNKPLARIKDFESVFEQQRKNCTQMLKIKHPGVLNILEPLEETSGQMILVTESVWGSLKNVLSGFREISTEHGNSNKETLSLLERKLGLSMLSETIQFLNMEAGLLHLGMNPQVVMLTNDGGWKIAGFAYCTSVGVNGLASQSSYHYGDPYPPFWELLNKPPLPCTAPELVAGGGSGIGAQGAVVGPPADVFSLAALAVELLGGTELLPVRNNVHEYHTRLTAPGGLDLSKMPEEMKGVLHACLSVHPGARPHISAITEALNADVNVRALRFLGTLLQRDTGAKLAFLKDFAQLWPAIDARLVRLKVLPPLLQEFRDPALQLPVLHHVCSMLGHLTAADFSSSVLPALSPLMEVASGETLVLLVQNSLGFSKLMTNTAVREMLVPLLVRSFQAGPPRLQVEALSCAVQLSERLEDEVATEVLLPQAHALVLRTTSGAVRSSAIRLMTSFVSRLSMTHCNNIMDTITQVTQVDTSPTTAMAAMELSSAISQRWGAQITARQALPLLTPLLISPTLSATQFNSLVEACSTMLAQIKAEVTPELERRQVAASALPTTTSNSNGSSTMTWDTPLPSNNRGKKYNNSSSMQAPAQEEWGSRSALPATTGISPLSTSARASSHTTTPTPSASYASMSNMSTAMSMLLSNNAAAGATWDSNFASIPSAQPTPSWTAPSPYTSTTMTGSNASSNANNPAAPQQQTQWQHQQQQPSYTNAPSSGLQTSSTLQHSSHSNASATQPTSQQQQQQQSAYTAWSSHSMQKTTSHPSESISNTIPNQQQQQLHQQQQQQSSNSSWSSSSHQTSNASQNNAGNNATFAQLPAPQQPQQQTSYSSWPSSSPQNPNWSQSGAGSHGSPLEQPAAQQQQQQQQQQPSYSSWSISSSQKPNSSEHSAGSSVLPASQPQSQQQQQQQHTSSWIHQSNISSSGQPLKSMNEPQTYLAANPSLASWDNSSHSTATISQVEQTTLSFSAVPSWSSNATSAPMAQTSTSSSNNGLAPVQGWNSNSSSNANTVSGLAAGKMAVVPENGNSAASFSGSQGWISASAAQLSTNATSAIKHAPEPSNSTAASSMAAWNGGNASVNSAGLQSSTYTPPQSVVGGSAANAASGGGIMHATGVSNDMQNQTSSSYGGGSSGYVPASASQGPVRPTPTSTAATASPAMASHWSQPQAESWSTPVGQLGNGHTRSAALASHKPKHTTSHTTTAPLSITDGPLPEDLFSDPETTSEFSMSSLSLTSLPVQLPKSAGAMATLPKQLHQDTTTTSSDDMFAGLATEPLISPASNGITSLSGGIMGGQAYSQGLGSYGAAPQGGSGSNIRATSTSSWNTQALSGATGSLSMQTTSKQVPSQNQGSAQNNFLI